LPTAASASRFAPEPPNQTLMSMPAALLAFDTPKRAFANTPRAEPAGAWRYGTAYGD